MFSKNANTQDSEITLGKKYRDTLHGIEGIAYSKHIFLTGCDRIVLQWVKDGEIKEESFDVTQLVAVEDEKPVKATKIAGGPQKTATPKRLG